MNVTSAILYPAPTMSTLDSRQRIRLVRSARKLGAILGTTPHVAGPHDKVPVQLLPIGASRPTTPPHEAWHPYSVAPHSTSTSASSSAASLHAAPVARTASLPDDPSRFFTPKPKIKPRKTKQVPAPLVLRYNAVPVAHSDPRARAAGPTTPNTADTLAVPGTAPLTPLTPTVPTQSETRRRRMAKLTRTLGENIPPELILGVSLGLKPKLKPAPAPPPPSTEKRRRSMSVDLGALAMQSQGRGPEKGVSGVKPAKKTTPARWATGAGEWNRQDIREVQRQLRTLKAR